MSFRENTPLERNKRENKSESEIFVKKWIKLTITGSIIISDQSKHKTYYIAILLDCYNHIIIINITKLIFWAYYKFHF